MKDRDDGLEKPSPEKMREEVRTELENGEGRRFWRSLEELADAPDFRQWAEKEFPPGASSWPESLSRRNFLRLVAGTLAVAGAGACTQRGSRGELLPYAEAPEGILPGKPLYYATSMIQDGYAIGHLAESHMGRPTKIEGNPVHPANPGGATDAFGQASIFTLYDPDRARAIIRDGYLDTWNRFVSFLTGLREAMTASRGRGLRILTGPVTSPTLIAQLESMLSQFPEARWHRFDPVGESSALQGARAAYGRFLNPVFRLEAAKVIVSLDADFMSWGPGRIAYSRQFADRRKVWEASEMNRLYSVATFPTLTAAMADHRLAAPPSQVEIIAAYLARELGVLEDIDEIVYPAPTSPLPSAWHSWIRAAARDLLANQGAGLILVGESQSPRIHALGYAINSALKNTGQTLYFTEPIIARPEASGEGLADLADAMRAGDVDALMILETNPVYAAPADIDFASALEKVPHKIHLSLFHDETSRRCNWHIPASHYLESWGDARAFDGTISPIQPVIEPLFLSKTPLEMMAVLLGNPMRSGLEIVREQWGKHYTGADFEAFWKQSLYLGILENSALPTETVTLAANWRERKEVPEKPDEGAQGDPDALQNVVEIVFLPDPTVWSGEYAPNAWLQELPKPMSKLTWDNAAYLSPGAAKRLDVKNQDLVGIRFGGKSVEAPVWVLTGHADGAVTVTLGYGRWWAGRENAYGVDVLGVTSAERPLGYNAYEIRFSHSLWHGRGAGIVKTGRTYPLASTQHHFGIKGREIVKGTTLESFIKNPDFAKRDHPLPSFFPEHAYKTYAWGMSIDMSICTGCSACVVACQAENNIPVVGKEQVAMGREMHWLRIDRYFEGPPENPATYFQPMLCQHCENAPCEVVCPVEATVHDGEGLNAMVYNRCIGTRFCSNNCPYKVRRFNFLEYVKAEPETLKMWRNPDVTVRRSGVMEKCTYCVQRIAHARIEAEKENRRIRDGEVVTACQQACPTRAIVFGDINLEGSRVSALKRHPLNYGVLGELNTQPRTTYLAKLWNPNPELREAM